MSKYVTRICNVDNNNTNYSPMPWSHDRRIASLPQIKPKNKYTNNNKANNYDNTGNDYT